MREAEWTGRSHQSGVDALTKQLADGNLNPGLGSEPIGGGISEARHSGGARVYFRQRRDGTIEILGKSNKANQPSVIAEVKKTFLP